MCPTPETHPRRKGTHLYAIGWLFLALDHDRERAPHELRRNLPGMSIRGLGRREPEPSLTRGQGSGDTQRALARIGDAGRPATARRSRTLDSDTGPTCCPRSAATSEDRRKAQFFRYKAVELGVPSVGLPCGPRPIRSLECGTPRPRAGSARPWPASAGSRRQGRPRRCRLRPGHGSGAPVDQGG